VDIRDAPYLQANMQMSISETFEFPGPACSIR
jgi:hypothetical protein